MSDFIISDGKVVKDGLVAVKYYQSTPRNLRIDNEIYPFRVKARISMCWVKDEHVSRVLSTKKTCCGGSKKRVFRLANESDVRRWTQGGGR